MCCVPGRTVAAYNDNAQCFVYVTLLTFTSLHFTSNFFFKLDLRIVFLFLVLVSNLLDFSTKEYAESDFTSRGDKRVTRYADHCPPCSLDLRKILNAVKADEADSAAGPANSSSGSTDPSEAWPWQTR